MSIRSLIRRFTANDKAVYWAPGPLDRNSKVTFPTPPVELGVRWDDMVETFTDTDGQIQTSMARVLLEPDFVVAPKGFIWHGKLVDLPDHSVPTNNSGALELRGIQRIPDRKKTIVVTTVFL